MKYPIPGMIGRWDLDGVRVYERQMANDPPRLACMRCTREAWCKHRQEVVQKVMDAPLLAHDMESRVIDLEVQPTQGLFVPVTLIHTGDLSFQAEVRALHAAGGRKFTIHLGDFYASDGRLGLREMFIQYVKSLDWLSCTSTAHHVLASRKPANLLDRWSLLNTGACLKCSIFHETDQDVPDIKTHPYTTSDPPF